jgi:glycosyltransferase involved in cell wall biosynthesis
MANITLKSPIIQILMATYNGERYLREQLDSILNQIYEDWQILVHDDGSSDETMAILKVYHEKYPQKIILIEDGCKMGGAKNNFVHLMTFVKAPYIVLCDQDDIWLPHKLETMVTLFAEYDLVLSDAIVINEQKQILLNSFMRHNRSKKGLLNNLIHNSYIGCCMGFNKKIYDLAMPIPLDVPMHDWWIGMIVESFGSCVFIDEPLIMYRRHAFNASKTTEESEFSLGTKINFRIILVKYLIQKWIKNIFYRIRCV